MNILCGKGVSTKELDYEGPNGTEKMQLALFVDKIFIDGNKRMEENPLLLMIPWLFDKQITSADKRFFINAKTFRDFIMSIINERKKQDIKEED